MNLSSRVTTRWLDDHRPLLDFVPDGTSPWAWLHEGDGLVGWGTAFTSEPGSGPDRFAHSQHAFDEIAEHAVIDDEVLLPGTGLVAFGSFAFADDNPTSLLVVPRIAVGRRGGATWLTTITVDGQPHIADDLRDAASPRVPAVSDRPRYAGSSIPDVNWLEAVATAVDRIRGGHLDKVVLARDVALWSRHRFDVIDIAARLNRRFASCYTFIADGLAGATPELLAARFDRQVTSRVLAGTAARGTDTDHDDQLGSELADSPKEQWEHRLAVQSVRNVLEAVSDHVSGDDHPFLLKLENVQHLATDFTAEVRDDESALEVAAALHPTAAVGGFPRQPALDLITELEQMDRGRYAAPVGWVDAKRNGEWGIALRCAQFEGARARLFAGVGVVEGSLPEAELAETRLKLLAMQSVIGASDD
ncbi:MAG: isochorismate synthase [Nitriliruptoraceae bacterium]